MSLSPNKLLLTIIALAFLLRFYHLGSTPPSVQWDEAAFGYNAYSVLKTGRDEYGNFLPLAFRSFDDYKPPLYGYLAIPSISVFGLEDFAVRLPSAAFGVLTVYITYLLVSPILKNKKISLLAGFLLAISPWHIQFSRIAFENNVAVFFIVLGVILFIKSTQEKKLATYLFFSVLSFSISLFLYQTPRLFTPLLGLALVLIFFKTIINKKKELIPSVVLLILVMSIFIPHVFSSEGMTRFRGSTIFEEKSLQFESAYKIEEDSKNGQEFIGRLLHNRRLIYLPKAIEGYLVHFNPGYLLITGDNERHHAPLMGVLYIWTLPFIIIGIYFLFKNNFRPRYKLLISAWFLLAAIPASVTIDVPHAHRTEVFLPTYQLFGAIGIFAIYKYVKRKKIFIMLSVLAFTLNFAFYLHQYFIHLPIEFSKNWIYGRKEAALFADKLKDDYDRVIVSTSLEKSNVMWLYYLKYDPEKYLDEGGTVSGGFLETRNKFDKYFFTPIDYQKQASESNTLFVGKPHELERSEKILKKVNFLNGEEAIYIAE